MIRLGYILVILFLIFSFFLLIQPQKENYSSGTPKYVIFFRHCDKETKVCDSEGSDTFPNCCESKSVPPFSCDDCSVKGYLRSYNLPNAMDNLLSNLGENKITSIYAAGSKEMNKNCSHSRRMWEMVVPLASVNNLPINTDFCTDQMKETAKDIVKNNSRGIVAVAWEHNALPELVGWVSAIYKDKHATEPDIIKINGVPLKWPGSDVFDQFWILDLSGAEPKFSTATQK